MPDPPPPAGGGLRGWEGGGDSRFFWAAMAAAEESPCADRSYALPLMLEQEDKMRSAAARKSDARAAAHRFTVSPEVDTSRLTCALVL